MKPRIDSRTSQIDTEKCVAQAGGRYDMVVAVANVYFITSFFEFVYL